MSDLMILGWCIVAVAIIWGLVWISDQEDDIWWGKDDEL